MRPRRASPFRPARPRPRGRRSLDRRRSPRPSRNGRVASRERTARTARGHRRGRRLDSSSSANDDRVHSGASCRPTSYGGSDHQESTPPPPARARRCRRPQLEVVGVARRAEHHEVGRVERRPHRLEAKTADALRRHVRLQQIEQQRRDERTVHHESRVSFDVSRVAAVVVNAMLLKVSAEKRKRSVSSGARCAATWGPSRQRPRAARRRAVCGGGSR